MTAAAGLLITGATEIATMAGGMRRGAAQADPALVDEPGPSLATVGQRILAVGGRERVEAEIARAGFSVGDMQVVDAAGGTVTPGLVDPHTHLLFAGTREGEVALRQQGASYMEILESGGGILSTVAATRAATAEALMDHGRRWLGQMMMNGVTTVEAKSGYGLDTATELRLLDVAGSLDREGPLQVVPTFLGAHAVPPEYRGRPGGTDAYVDHVVEEQLPAVAEQGIARSCDVFCERGVFTPEQSRRVLQAAQGLGLEVRLHADELSPSGGAQLAALMGARSADHLAAVDDDGIACLAEAAAAGRPTVATLLPATTLVLLSRQYAPARALIDGGVPVALGTDFNPGTSPTSSLALVLSLACLQLGISAGEALAAVTINAAGALGLDASVGSLEPGKQADVVIWDVPSHRLLPYWLGARLSRAVIKRGALIG